MAAQAVGPNAHCGRSDNQAYFIFVDNHDADGDGKVEMKSGGWVGGRDSWKGLSVLEPSVYDANARTVTRADRGWFRFLRQAAIIDITVQRGLPGEPSMYEYQVWQDLGGQRGALLYELPEAMPLFMTELEFV